MRKRLVETFACLLGVLVGSSLAVGDPSTAQKQQTAPPASNSAQAKQPPAKPGPEKAEVARLEEMLGNALKNNPDIRVAEAKLHEAEAELNRIRLQVMQKVITFRLSLEAQKKQVKQAQERYDDTAKLFKSGALSAQLFSQAESALTQEKSKLATLEAEMPSLLGKLPQSASQTNKPDGSRKSAATDPAQPWRTGELQSYPLWSYALNNQALFSNQPLLAYPQLFDATHPYLNPSGAPWRYPVFPATAGSVYPIFGELSAYNQAFTTVPAQPARGAIADKLRQALDTVVSLDIKDKPFPEALKMIQQKAPGIPFHTVLPADDFAKQKVTLQLEQVPFGAALQALEDSFPDTSDSGGFDALRLAVREYGILVTRKHLLPSGATLLHDFWKGDHDKKGQKPRAANDPAGSSSAKNPPANEIAGTIKAIDPQTNYVTISIGTDAGLSKGNTLEVYRLKPEPMYLGTIEILAVRPDQAVAKPISRPHGAIQVGDRVASKVLSGR